MRLASDTRLGPYATSRRLAVAALAKVHTAREMCEPIMRIARRNDGILQDPAALMLSTQRRRRQHAPRVITRRAARAPLFERTGMRVGLGWDVNRMRTAPEVVE